MAMESSLNVWMQGHVKGDIIAAVGHKQTASLVTVERVRDDQSSEIRLDLHIYQWYKSLIGAGSEKGHHTQQKTCFIKAFDDQLEFDTNRNLNVEISLSKNGDLLAIFVDGDVYVTQFDLSSYTGGSSTRKQSIVVFHQCLTHLKNLNASSFQFHPEINNALSILSSELRRLLILELLVDDGSIDATSIEEPAYSIDLSKATESTLVSFSFTNNSGPHDASIFTGYLLSSNGTLFAVGPFIYKSAPYSTKLVDSLKSIARQFENSADYSEASREIVEGFISPLLGYLRSGSIEGKSAYYLGADDTDYLRQVLQCGISRSIPVANMDNRQSSLNMNHLLAIKTGRYLLLTTLDSMGNARLLLSSTVTMTLGKVDRKNDGLVDIGSIVVGKAEDRVSGSLKIESAVRRCAYMARAIAEDSQITVNVLGKLEEVMTKAGTIESGYTAQNMIDYSLKHHCRKLAIADNGTSITCMAKIDIDTAVLFQTAPENKAVEKRVKLAFVDKSIDADIGSRSYDYIKPDQINSALNAITKPDKPQISKYSPLDMNEIDKLLEKMTKLKSSFDEHLSKVNESNLTSDLWLDKLSSIQQETAKTAIALKSKLSSAIAETCKKTAHFQSDYYKMIDTQQANFKQHEGIVSRLNKMKIKNDRLRKICKAKLEQSAIDTHDQNLVDTVARSTADMSKFVDVVKSRFEAAAGRIRHTEQRIVEFVKENNVIVDDCRTASELVLNEGQKIMAKIDNIEHRLTKIDNRHS